MHDVENVKGGAPDVLVRARCGCLATSLGHVLCCRLALSSRAGADVLIWDPKGGTLGQGQFQTL